MLDQLAKQKQIMTNLVDRAAQMSQDAETAEPLLSHELYDTVRKFNTDSANDLKDVQDQLVDHGLMPRNLYDQLKNSSEQDGAKLMDLTSEMLKLDFLPPANETARRSGTSLDNLRRGVERAADSVLGDDTEALRVAQEQLNQLTDELTREMGRGANTNANQQASAASRNAGNRNAGNRQGQPENAGQRGTQPGDQAGDQTAQAENQNGQQGDQAGSRQNNSGRGNQGQQGQRSDRQTASANQGQRGGDGTGNGETQPADANAQDAQGQGQGQRSGQAQTAQGGREGQTQTAQAGRNGGQPRDGQQRAQNRNGGQLDGGGDTGGDEGRGGNGGDRVGNILDRFANNDNRAGGAPITGEGFVPWSDRLRDVEEMIDAPDLRNQVATARERARLLRQQYNKTREKPDWAVVQLQVVKPLVEVRDRIAEELARRGSEQALVPLDRDPVPTRYSDLVKKYYEELGKAK
jgi:hypothetical protein